METSTPAGWYTDPQDPTRERFFDGQVWTDQYRPRAALLPASAPSSAVSDKSRLVAALLAFFLGSLGIHSFYVGKNGIGIAQIVITVVSCGTLGWVWPLIDFIMIVAGSYTDEQGRVVYDWESRPPA